MPGQASPPPLLSQTGIGGILEFFGGIAIMLGLWTRPGAFVLSGMMAVAYWQFHAPNAVSPVQNQGVPAVLFCFLFLYLSAQGGGEWSIDALLGRATTKERRKIRATQKLVGSATSLSSSPPGTLSQSSTNVGDLIQRCFRWFQ